MLRAKIAEVRLGSNREGPATSVAGQVNLQQRKSLRTGRHSRSGNGSGGPLRGAPSVYSWAGTGVFDQQAAVKCPPGQWEPYPSGRQDGIPAVPSGAGASVRQQNLVDNLDHAIALIDVGDRYVRRATLLVGNR